MTETAERSNGAMGFSRPPVEEVNWAEWPASFYELPVFKRVLCACVLVGFYFALMALCIVTAVYAAVLLSGWVIAALFRGKKTPPPDHRPGKELQAPALET